MSLFTKPITSRPLGNTGIEVSSVALGTVELGMDYGIQAPGEYGRPTEEEAIRLLHEAADCGINVFDTAPAYGTSEELLGRALSKRSECLIATKVNIPLDDDRRSLVGKGLQNSIYASLTNSLRALRRDRLDIVQIHNATVALFVSDEWRAVMENSRQQGLVRLWGASVYTEEEALAAIQSGLCHILQVPYNLLDQKMAERVIPCAEEAAVAIMVRSAYLKGVLTEKAEWLPDALKPLESVVSDIRCQLGVSWKELSQMALRFCLSTLGVSTVLVGLRTHEELHATLESVELGALSPGEFRLAQTWALHDEPLLNPSYWPV